MVIPGGGEVECVSWRNLIFGRGVMRFLVLLAACLVLGISWFWEQRVWLSAVGQCELESRCVVPAEPIAVSPGVLL